ncbi:hypothetical protein [Amycolatopsis thermoflava]|uniref:hypothetical protein n=1 Tax=Amycolatopsis thermoflava TaxID=84480 RepID=UPI003D763BD8
MPYFVEFVHYRTDLPEDRLVALRSAAILAVRDAHPDLLSVPALSRGEDGSWTDVWIYRTQEAAEKANAGAGDIPEFTAFAGALSGVEITAGHMPDSAVSPL